MSKSRSEYAQNEITDHRIEREFKVCDYLDSGRLSRYLRIPQPTIVASLRRLNAISIGNALWLKPGSREWREGAGVRG